MVAVRIEEVDMNRVASICLASVFAASMGIAQVHPVLDRGFAPDKIFRVGDVDSINPFNGNLIISIPVGPGIILSICPQTKLIIGGCQLLNTSDLPCCSCSTESGDK